MKYPNIILMVLILFVSCKKESTVSNDAKSPVGKWSWIATYADIPISNTNPKTPQNSNIHELLIFNSDNTFKVSKNDTIIDSGSYTYGHGNYTNLSNKLYEYDSIRYFHNNVPISGGIDYYTFYNDSLVFNPGLANQWLSYSVSYFGGSKWWKKQ